ncbi:hypothetical protein C2S52_019307 [Perilla frutescens var. hirtella]|nr:hypothetical protein C2S52_019307 [Perilla frutescens var. hirtella]
MSQTDIDKEAHAIYEQGGEKISLLAGLRSRERWRRGWRLVSATVDRKRLNEAIYVHYNLRERQMRKRSSNSVSLDSVLQEDLLYDWIVETEKQTLQEDDVPIDHEILYSEMDHGDGYENDLQEFDDGHT